MAAYISRVCTKNFLVGSKMPRSPASSLVQGLTTGTRSRLLIAPLFSSPFSSDSSSDQVTVQQPKGQTSSLSTDESLRRRRRRGLQQLWRNSPWNWNLLPFRSRNSPEPIAGLGSLGNALVQASHNLNNLLKNWIPSQLLGRVKEDDKSYKLRFDVPGLGKEDIKVTVEDGFLVINGEHKEEERGGDEDDDGDYEWYSQRYYSTSLLLPNDAEVEGIKAEVKDGVLYVTIPRSQDQKKRDVREVEIH